MLAQVWDHLSDQINWSRDLLKVGWLFSIHLQDKLYLYTRFSGHVLQLEGNRSFSIVDFLGEDRKRYLPPRSLRFFNECLRVIITAQFIKVCIVIFIIAQFFCCCCCCFSLRCSSFFFVVTKLLLQ